MNEEENLRCKFCPPRTHLQQRSCLLSEKQCVVSMSSLRAWQLFPKSSISLAYQVLVGPYLPGHCRCACLPSACDACTPLPMLQLCFSSDDAPQLREDLTSAEDEADGKSFANIIFRGARGYPGKRPSVAFDWQTLMVADTSFLPPPYPQSPRSFLEVIQFNYSCSFPHLLPSSVTARCTIMVSCWEGHG